VTDWPEILRQIPGYDPYTSAGDCEFISSKADTAIEFFETCITHVKGELAGTPFILADWQKAIIGNLFGWIRPDGSRRYREAFIYVPRKNGKTTLAAGIILLVMFTDHEPGAEIYSAAGEKEQATLIFSQCEGMIHNEPEFEKRVRIYTAVKSIVYDAERTSYKAISAEAGTKHGFNSHLVVVDELHVQPNRDLVDVLQTSTGSRRQPLMVYITTSDFARESICNEKHEYACKVRDGIIDDPYMLPVVYGATLEDDWTSEEVWQRVNPCLGISLSKEYIRAQFEKATNTPTFENTFKRLHLNIQTEQDVRWIQMDKWKACGSPVDAELLAGCVCYAGLDLSTTTDITALVLSFDKDGTVYLLPKFWLPREGAKKRQDRDRVPYLTWANQGLITLTEGDVIDYDVVRRDINELDKIYQIKEVAIDRWNATQLTTQLAGDGFEVVPFGQGFASMSGPSKEFEKLILEERIAHGGHPVLKWMASNVAAEIDAAGNIKPSKKKSTERIDGIVASIMAIGRWAANLAPKTSVYEERGVLSF
jgi:phage terminase large subunit-like protein